MITPADIVVESNESFIVWRTMFSRDNLESPNGPGETATRKADALC